MPATALIADAGIFDRHKSSYVVYNQKSRLQLIRYAIS